MPYLSDIEADPTRDRAFVSGGGGTEAIEIVDTDGKLAGTVPIQHAADMLLSDDASTLFVAVRRDNMIAMVDTGTLDVTSIDLGPVEPQRLAWAAGLLWITHSSDPDSTVGINLLAVNVDSRQIHNFPLIYGIEDVVSSSAAPDVLVASGSGNLNRFAVTGGQRPALQLIERRELADGSSASIWDLAMTSDGKQVIVSGAAGDFDSVVRVRDLALVDSYPTSRYSTAVAVRDDGQIAIGTHRNDEVQSAHVSVYRAGHTSHARRYRFANTETGPQYESFYVTRRGLAWGENELFVAVTDHHGGQPAIVVLDDDVPAASPLQRRSIDRPDFYAIKTVPELGRAFITPGVTGNGLYVLDRRGRVTNLLEHMPGASGMTLNRSRTKLYVGLAAGDAIAVVDTRTLRTRILRTGDLTCPSSIALVGSRIWFSGFCWGTGGPVRVLNPTTGSVRRVDGVAGNHLLASPGHPRTLWVAHTEAISGSLVRYEIERGSKPGLIERARVGAGPSQIDQLFSSDGLHLLPVSPGFFYSPALNPRSLALQAAPPMLYTPVAAAVRSDGLLASAVGSADLRGFYREPDDWTVRLFSSPLGRQLTDPGLALPDKAHVEPRGIAFGGRDLYAVTSTGTGLRIRMMKMPPVRLITLTSGRSSYKRDETAHLVAHLSRPLAPNTLVSIFRRARQGKVLIKRSRPDGDNNVHLRVATRPGDTYVAQIRERRNPRQAQITIRSSVSHRYSADALRRQLPVSTHPFSG